MNGTMLQGFTWYLPADGKHWERIASKAACFADKGVTAVWHPPAFKGAEGINDVGYSVYDTYDLGEFYQRGSVVTKYGTKAGYLACIHALKRHGITALGDVVLNHRSGADYTERVWATEVAHDDRTRRIGSNREIEAFTRFTFPGRRGMYSDFTWDWTCFDAFDRDMSTGADGIYLFDGKAWEAGVDVEKGSFDYLMGCDLDLDNPVVYDELVRWGCWYVRTTGVDGLRLDALKHMDREFYRRWLEDIRSVCGYDLFAVGEYWSGDIRDLRNYLGGNRHMCLFDVPLHFRLHDASVAHGSYDLRRLFEGTLVAENPLQAVTFVENHDTQVGQSLQSPVDPWFKPAAYAIILLREAGYPCVFYGDLYEVPGQYEGSPAFLRPVCELPCLMRVRQHLAYGNQRDYLDRPQTIGWTRDGMGAPAGAGGCAVVVGGPSGGERWMCVGDMHAGERWVSIIGGGDAVEIDHTGHACFRACAGALGVYVPEWACHKLSGCGHGIGCD